MSLKASLMAVQISSVETSTISSTHMLDSRKVSSPTPHAAAAEAGVALQVRGELIDDVNDKSASLADAAREYRDNARRERERIDAQKARRWHLFGKK